MKLEIGRILDQLFPINRSITGDGLRQSLAIIGQHLPLRIIEYPTGMQCYDWEIPKEWNITDAYIADLDGKRIVDFQKSNLHVLGYSTPFSGQVSKEELIKHIYTLPEMPAAIPYVVSFYEPRWGFSMAYQEFIKLDQESYQVRIDSTLENGSLTIGECYIPGQSAKEVLLHTYIGHPSMANDQLSGPLTLLAVGQWLRDSQPSLKYSYRILFCPETIGTIAYLSRNFVQLKESVIAGYVVAFSGDRGRITYKQAKEKDSLANRAASNALMHRRCPYQIKAYTPFGADERQFNAPGIDLPMGCIMRSGPGEYREYHTSLDNQAVVSAEKILDSAQFVIEAIKNIEINGVVQAVHKMCEPKLDKRGLYPTLGKNSGGKELAKSILGIWGMADGQADLLQIADALGVPAHEMAAALTAACRENLIKII